MNTGEPADPGREAIVAALERHSVEYVVIDRCRSPGMTTDIGSPHPRPSPLPTGGHRFSPPPAVRAELGNAREQQWGASVSARSVPLTEASGG